MAMGYRFCFAFLAFVGVIAQLATAAGTIFTRAIEAVLVRAFPVAEPYLPMTGAEATPVVIGLAKTRSYEERRLQRSEREVSFGRGLCIAT